EKERKRIYEELLASEFRYRRLFDNITDAFVSVSMSGRIQDYNPAFREMVGYTDEELPKLSFVHLTPEKWHAFEWDIVEQQVLKRGYSEVYEKEYIRKDGAIVPVELRTYLICGNAGQPEGMWAIVRNCTERRKLQDDLSILALERQIILDSAPVGISLINDNIIVRANRRMEEIFRYPPSELEGQRVEMLFSSKATYEQSDRNAHAALIKGVPFK